MICGELIIETPLYKRVTWKIPNFFQLSREESYFVESQEFSFDGLHFLRLYPDANKRVLVSTDGMKNISYNLTFKTSSGKEIYFHRLRPTSQRPSPARYKVPTFFISRQKLEGNKDSYVPNGTLTLIFYLVLKSNEGSPEFEATDKDTGAADLKSDYRQLLQKGTDSDAFLEVSGKEFRAHRCILRARSPVFNAMFGHPMAEKDSGRVVIDDLNPDCFVHFLEYLYTGVIGEGLLDIHAFGLYKAADKYGVLSLKSECVAHMRRTLTVDSFCDIVTLSEMHCEEELLQLAVNFFKQNLRRIISTPKWQQFLIDNSKTANELFMKSVLP